MKRVKKVKKVVGVKKNDLRPKHFRGSSLDVREAEAERKKKEEKLGIHSRADSIGIGALMKTLGTDDLFAIHVGGLGAVTRDSSDLRQTPRPYKPTIGLGSLSEDGDEELPTSSSPSGNSPTSPSASTAGS